MSERLKNAYREAEDRLSLLMQEMHERGELRHLHGKQLEIREDDPAWLVARMMKQEGFSHPLLERRREVEAQLRGADAQVERLMQRRNRLLDEQTTLQLETVGAFNEGRRFALQDYRARLVELNRIIRDYNLTVPLALHISAVQIERQMAQVESLVSALEPDLFRAARQPARWWMRLLPQGWRERLDLGH